MATVSKVKVTEGSWKGQEGEFVREDEASGRVVARMAGNRLVEFDPAHVAPVEDAEAEQAGE